MAKLYNVGSRGDATTTTGSTIISVKDSGIGVTQLSFGTLKKVAETTVTGSATTSFDFQNLDINTDKLYKIVVNAVNDTGSGADVNLYINGDTTSTNYYSQFIYADDAALSSARNNSAFITTLEASSRTGCSIDLMLDIDGYTRAIGNTIRKNGSTIQLLVIGHSKTATVANITRIQLTASVANAFKIGSRVTIYAQTT